MKDAEKLQRLLEIAWRNEYERFKDWPRDPDYYIDSDLVLSIGRYDVEYVQVENLIFDHEFIKALCRAKWGEIHYGTVDLEFSTCELRTFDGEGNVIKTEGINYKEKFSHDSMYSYYLARLAISDNRLEYLWQTFGGGLRRSEVADLRISDCEFFKDDLLVTLRKPKSGHEQTQSIPIWAANAVRDLIQQAIDNGLSSSNYLIPGKAGRIGDTTIYRIFRRCLKRAGLKGSFSPHSARATAITKLLSDGVDPRAVQEFARHSDFYVTQRYDLREGLGMQAAKKLKY